MAPIPLDPDTPAPGPDIRVSMGVSCAFGYIIIGIIVYTCMNGYRLQAPKWYAESPRKANDKALLALFCAGVLALWPFLVPYLILKKTAKECAKVRERSRREAVKDEEDEYWAPTREGGWEEVRLESGQGKAWTVNAAK